MKNFGILIKESITVDTLKGLKELELSFYYVDDRLHGEYFKTFDDEFVKLWVVIDKLQISDYSELDLQIILHELGHLPATSFNVGVFSSDYEEDLVVEFLLKLNKHFVFVLEMGNGEILSLSEVLTIYREKKRNFL